MAKINLVSENSTLGVTVEESDEYTEMVHLKFEKHVIPENMHSSNEIFLTPHQLEVIGRFFLEQALQIHNIQSIRDTQERLSHLK